MITWPWRGDWPPPPPSSPAIYLAGLSIYSNYLLNLELYFSKQRFQLELLFSFCIMYNSSCDSYIASTLNQSSFDHWPLAYPTQVSKLISTISTPLFHLVAKNFCPCTFPSLLDWKSCEWFFLCSRRSRIPTFQCRVRLRISDLRTKFGVQFKVVSTVSLVVSTVSKVVSTPLNTRKDLQGLIETLVQLRGRDPPLLGLRNRLKSRNWESRRTKLRFWKTISKLTLNQAGQYK